MEMGKTEKVSGMRKIIAERMSDSWHVSPRVVYSLSVDMTKPLAYIDKLNEGREDKSKKVTVNHILMRACADAMKEYEYVNSSFADNTITVHDQINIGLAVAVEKGLIVPNIKDVGSKNIDEIAEIVNDLVYRARNNKLNLDEIEGGTFTITNLGMMGIENFSPIINQPEVAILAVNKIIDTPVAEDGQVVIKPKMNLNFVADHRVIDGAYAARYIKTVKEILENL